MIEVGLFIICGSLATFHPLLNKFFPSVSERTYDTTLNLPGGESMVAIREEKQGTGTSV
jgi:hypothetical protein